MQHRKRFFRFVTYQYALAVAVAILCVILAGQISVSSLGQTKSSLRVLIMGGGTSHDFAQNYQQIDSKVLGSAGDSVRYVDDWAQLAEGLKNTKVLIQASNQILPPEPAVRDAIMNFAHEGGGLLVVHAGLWYNWPTWPEYNRVLVGGGSRSHDKLGDFEVIVTHPEHPIMQGVPAKFLVHDELYHQEFDPSGSPVEVLATATSPLTGKTYPSVWVVNSGHGCIVCIAAGHGDKTHNDPTYMRLLTNAANWAAQSQ